MEIEWQYRKKLKYLILITVLIKLGIAGIIELGNDEVYYYTYALQPDWNHFDHPPLVGLLIRLSTLNLYWLSGLSLRLGAILSCAVSTIFIYKTGKIISNAKTGWYAALIYNFSVYSGIIAGLFILPDSPQMPFWTASLYLMSCILFKKEEGKWGLWLMLGFMIGMASMSKVHGLYLWLGFGIFILMTRIKWLINWRIYASIALTIICVLPIFYWNIQNDFITYRFHSERVTHHEIQLDSLVREILGEFAYQNPINFILIIVSLIYLLRNRNMLLSNVKTWLFCMSFPMILLFWGISLFNPTLPHWAGPAYLPLYFIAARYCEEKEKTSGKFKWIPASGIFLSSLLIIALFVIRLSPVNFGSHNKANYGEYCPTLDITGWENFSTDFEKLVKEDAAHQIMKKNSFIIVSKWFPGGHIEFYTATKTGLPVIGLGTLGDLHKFAWLNKENNGLQLGADAYYIVPSNVPSDPHQLFNNYFRSIDTPVIIEQVRNGGIVRHFYIYRLKDCIRIPDPVLH